MLNVGGLLLVMLRSSFIVAFLSIPSPVVAFTGLKNWSRRALYTKVDLCTQSCYSQIIPGLYLSNAMAARDRQLLEHLGITHVLTIDEKRIPNSTFENSDISTLYIMAYDTPETNILPYFPIANAYIEEGLSKGKVLVHCHLGVSRSASLVIAYLMQKYKLDFNEAYLYVRKRRRFINPNPGFINQLQLYHKSNYYVSGYNRLGAYMNVNAGENKYKIMSIAAVFAGIMIPAVLFFV